MTMSAATLTRSDLETRLLPLADRYRGRKGITIPLLADMQREMGYIAPEAVDFIAKELGPMFYNAGIDAAIATHLAWGDRIQEEMDLKKVY